VEAALGIGIERKREVVRKEEDARKDIRDIKRPIERNSDPRFAPCHAIVIENLENYRPEETRTRRENRQLMTWSSSKVKKYLSESCELNGLHLRQVHAGYTSRQDSRTGAPGIRCSDKPVKVFIAIMKTRIGKINVSLEKGGTEEDKYLKAEFDRWNENEKIWTDKCGEKWKLEENKWKLDGGTRHKNVNEPHPVRIPQKGGEIFVSADAESPLKNGIQADLNAAANIGLRALLDPDWNGKWWYVPCSPKDYIPLNDKIKGSTVFETKKSLKISEVKDGEKEKSKKDVVNLWKDISANSLYTGNWREYAPYWNDATSKVVKNLKG
jgi:IS605 OrfB family transposase